MYCGQMTPYGNKDLSTLATCHYLNQWWLIVSWTIENIFHRNLIKIPILSFKKMYCGLAMPYDMICVNIGSADGLVPIRHQTITWTNDVLSIELLGTYVMDVSYEMHDGVIYIGKFFHCWVCVCVYERCIIQKIRNKVLWKQLFPFVLHTCVITAYITHQRQLVHVPEIGNRSAVSLQRSIFFPKYSQQTPHSSPVRAMYEVSFMSSNNDLLYSSVRCITFP